MVTYIFLLHNFGVKIVLFEFDNLKKNPSEGKKIWLNACTKPLLEDAIVTYKTKTRGTF